MATAIYYRVSTEEQSLSMQQVAIDAWIKRNEYVDPCLVFQDIGISGATIKRPGFQKMARAIEKRKIQTVLVYKLDRLSRDALTAIRFILRLDELGVGFIATTQPMFSFGTPFRHAMVAIFAELAQMERETIIERVNAGIAAAKKRGVRFGAPVKLTPEKLVKIRELRVNGLTFKQIAAEVGLSAGSVHKAIVNATNDNINKDLCSKHVAV